MVTMFNNKVRAQHLFFTDKAPQSGWRCLSMYHYNIRKGGGWTKGTRPSGARAGAASHWVGVDEDGEIPAWAQGTQKSEPLNGVLEVCLQSGEAPITSLSQTSASLH